MASLERRLQQLETHAATIRREDEAVVGREVMRRLTDEELDTYEEALRRALESGEFAEENRPILERVQRLYEEVANEVTSAS
jgi:hypothetical protein